MPETALVPINARHTEAPGVEILDTPRRTRGSGKMADLEVGGKKVWSAGHLGVGHSPSPGVFKVGAYSGAWAAHTFNVAEDGEAERCNELMLVVEEGHGGFAVIKNIKVLGMTEEVAGGRGGGREGGDGSASWGSPGLGLSGRLGRGVRAEGGRSGGRKPRK